jgi:hypothetical protein
LKDRGGKMATTLFPEFPDTPIFEPQERERLKTNQYVRPYAAITKPQLVGLLIALGEYACRVTTDQPPIMGTLDPELAEKHRSLVDCYWDRTRDTTDVLSGQFVFDAQERSTLFLYKYVSRHCAFFSKQEVLILLEALERYSLVAPRIEQIFGPLTGAVRMIHAHNALVRFRDKPFTQDEFHQSVRAVLNGENSRLLT